jgi:inorganic pyrophosphatase/exopolyphosphatase
MQTMLREFLRARRDPSVWAGLARVRVVLGNEACDADSAISALALSFVREQAQSAVEDRTTWVPVVSCARDVFPLRRDAVLALEKAGIDLEDLVFLDEAPWDALGRHGDSALVLVDHNRLASTLRSKYPWLEERIVGIVDHHEDHGAYEHVRGEERVVGWDAAAGRGVGSTCTLVAAEARRRGLSLEAGLARLLVSVILVDTVNLDVAAARATPLDVEMVEELGALCGLGTREEQTSEFVRLSEAKHDARFWASLTLRQKLEFDAKRFTMGRGAGGAMLKIASSSVLQPLALVVGRGGVSAAPAGGGGRGADVSGDSAAHLQRRARELGCDLLQLGSMLVEAGDAASMRRELLFFAPAADMAPEATTAMGGAEKLLDALLADCRPGGGVHDALRTEVMWHGEARDDDGTCCGWVALLQQHNVAASRKQVIPALGRWWERQRAS